ncbi:hypothetical protein ACUIJP_00995 [Leuconostoc pseudomesenteroides]|uniref:hypothetical protein n=1 Tax=Leuconostoc pseudomesenteroides TaxID=33968 RepID=UPI00403D646D
MQDLKFLTHHRNRLTDSRSKAEDAIHSIFLFPELAGFIGKTNLHYQYVYDLLTKYPSPAKLSRAHTNALVKLLHNHGNRLDMAQQLKVLAKQSIGLSSPANALELVQTISVIRLYDEQINAIDSINCTNNEQLRRNGSHCHFHYWYF